MSITDYCNSVISFNFLRFSFVWFLVLKERRLTNKKFLCTLLPSAICTPVGQNHATKNHITTPPQQGVFDDTNQHISNFWPINPFIQPTKELTLAGNGCDVRQHSECKTSFPAGASNASTANTPSPIKSSICIHFDYQLLLKSLKIEYVRLKTE